MTDKFKTHYSNAQLMTDLRLWSKRAAKQLKKDFPADGDEYPILCYTGMSGVSHATALAIELDRTQYTHGLVYVRKLNERSNGVKVEVSIPRNMMLTGKTGVLVMVDDFSLSGRTLYYTFWNALSDPSLRDNAGKVKATRNGEFYCVFGGDGSNNFRPESIGSFGLPKDFYTGGSLVERSHNHLRSVWRRYFNALNAMVTRNL